MDTREIRERLLSLHPSPDSPWPESTPTARFAGPNQALQQLTQMGFSPAACERAIAFSGSDRVDDILNYLLEGPRGWEHEFIRKMYEAREDDESLCLFCNDVFSKHLPEFSPSSAARSDIRSFPALVEQLGVYQDSHPDLTCGICYDSVVTPFSLSDDDFSHVYCRSCVEEYLEALISEAKVDKIVCPGVTCGLAFADQDIRRVVSPVGYEKYQRFKERNTLMRNPNLRWCAQANCSGYMEGSDDAPKMECPVCRQLQCFWCGSQWHEGKTCDQMQDQGYHLWAQEHEVQLCPKCKRPVEKNAGCNHMTCAICHYEFCWLCGQHYTASHFSSLNPFGCAGLQSGNIERRNWPRWRIYIKRVWVLFIWLALLLLFPLLLVLAPSIYAAVQVYEHSRMDRCSRIVLAGVVCVITIVLTPLGAAVLIPSLCLLCIYKVSSIMNAEVSAQQHIDVKKVSITQQIASECHLHCFGSQATPDCLEKCYDNMLIVFNGCLKALKEVGKERNSRYMRLVFGPMEDRLLRVQRFNEMRPSMQGNPDHYLERDYYDLTKDT